MPRTKSTTAPAPTEASAPAPAETETPQYEPDTVLIGRLTRDPILRTTKTTGKPTTIRIAVNDGPEATFHDVVCWGRTAEAVCQFKKKGHLVEVTGKAQTRDWTDRDGNMRQSAEVSAYRVQFGRSKAAVASKDLS